MFDLIVCCLEVTVVIHRLQNNDEMMKFFTKFNIKTD